MATAKKFVHKHVFCCFDHISMLFFDSIVNDNKHTVISYLNYYV